MKSWIIVVAVLLAAGFGGGRPDFSGTWKLDKKMSKNLPPSFKMVSDFSLEVAQSADSMVTTTSFSGMGGANKLPPTIVKFDGAEVYREDTARGTKKWISGTWTTTGQKLLVTSRVTQRTMSGAEQKYTETDSWQFGKHNTLLIIQTKKFEPGDSTVSDERYFKRAD